MRQRLIHWVVHICLAVIIVLMGRAVVRLENFHYAAFLDMCDKVPSPLIRLNPTPQTDRHACLHATETRTSFGWHIYYALTEPY